MIELDTKQSTVPKVAPAVVLRQPGTHDGGRIYELIRACKPLDLNSTYAYLLLCHHFSDTCVLAECQGEAVGFVSAFLPPRREDVIFVWQVAVAAQLRGRGLARSMLRELLGRSSLREVNYLETTVSPSNEPSRRMFRALALELETECVESTLFPMTLFGDESHEEEVLLRIGRFATNHQRRI